MRIYLKCIGFILLVTACTTSKSKLKTKTVQERQAKQTGKEPDSLSFFLGHYDKFFATNFNVSECPGAAVVIVKDTTVIYKKGFGVKQINTQDSVDVIKEVLRNFGLRDQA